MDDEGTEGVIERWEGMCRAVKRYREVLRGPEGY